MTKANAYNDSRFSLPQRNGDLQRYTGMRKNEFYNKVVPGRPEYLYKLYILWNTNIKEQQ